MPGSNGRGTAVPVELPVVKDCRGDICFLEAGRQVPFDIKRVYFLYNVPVDSVRGGHAHLQLEQVLFAISGSFRVTLNDGATNSEYILRDPRKGIHISRLVWREIDCFSQGAVCMVVASLHYDENDYIRNFDDFLKRVGKNLP